MLDFERLVEVALNLDSAFPILVPGVRSTSVRNFNSSF